MAANVPNVEIVIIGEIAVETKAILWKKKEDKTKREKKITEEKEKKKKRKKKKRF